LEFSSLLWKILGVGTLSENEHDEIHYNQGFIKLFLHLIILLKKNYPEINNISTKENTWFHERAILCPKN